MVVVLDSRKQQRKRSGGPARLPPKPARGSAGFARPIGFKANWEWAVGQASAACDQAPLRIHDEDRVVEHDQGKKKCPTGPCPLCDDTGFIKVNRGEEMIVGWPFSRPFEKYIDGKRTAGAWLETMERLYSPRARWPHMQNHEYRILHALANGHTDSEIVRALIGGCRVQFFEAAAMRAFGLVYDRAREGFTK